MTISRRHLIDAETTPYYHVMTRCVRRAYLCGQDELTGRDFSHRRLWIEDSIFKLSKVFAIDIAAYAVMSNHYHLVLHIDQYKANTWTVDEVFAQYFSYFKPGYLVQQYLNGIELSPAQLLTVNELADLYRDRLMSISWFMKVLNQTIARRANIEDNCTGKFFESRFKSQALLDNAALLTCMAYVDLNPIRAKIAETPESSDFTSIQTRLNRNNRQVTNIKKSLLGFIKPKAEYRDKGIPMTEAAYIELVDWTGRCIRNDKRGAIPTHLPPILERLNITEHEWLRHTRFFEARFKRVAGTWDSIKRAAEKFGKKWFQGKPPKPKPLPT